MLTTHAKPDSCPKDDREKDRDSRLLKGKSGQGKRGNVERPTRISEMRSL